MRVPALAFKETLAGRTMWAVIVDSSEPGDGAGDPLVGALHKTAAYMEMKWGGTLYGHGNRPGDVEKDRAAWEEARRFFALRMEG